MGQKNKTLKNKLLIHGPNLNLITFFKENLTMMTIRKKVNHLSIQNKLQDNKLINY